MAAAAEAGSGGARRRRCWGGSACSPPAPSRLAAPPRPCSLHRKVPGSRLSSVLLVGSKQAAPPERYRCARGACAACGRLCGQAGCCSGGNRAAGAGRRCSTPEAPIRCGDEPSGAAGGDETKGPSSGDGDAGGLTAVCVWCCSSGWIGRKETKDSRARDRINYKYPVLKNCCAWDQRAFWSSPQGACPPEKVGALAYSVASFQKTHIVGLCPTAWSCSQRICKPPVSPYKHPELLLFRV